MIKSMEENGLAIRDLENGAILFNSDNAIEQMINEVGGIDVVEYKRYASEIMDALGGESRYIQKTDTRLEFPLESGKEPNIGALKRIHKMIPEIYKQEIETL